MTTRRSAPTDGARVVRGSSTTKWIVAAAAAVTVVAISIVVIVTSLRADPPTEQVDSTTVPPTIPPSTDVPTTLDAEQTTTTEPADVDETTVSIRVGTRDRRYLLISPRRLAPGEQVPTVVVVHGLGVSSEAMSRSADWRGAVEQHRFLAVFPQGELDSWNMGPCCPPASVLGVDDLGYLDAVVAEMRVRPGVDMDRLFLTGFSNGGLMVYEYACARPQLFAAIAPMAASNLTGCSPAEPLPLFHQHSEPDNVVPYRGGLAIASILSASEFPSVPGSVGAWAEDVGCGSRFTSVVDDDDVEHMEWQGCPEGVRVELNRIPGRGHAWPSRGGYDPLDTMLDFFGIS